jgi:hypothetical protein
LRIQFPSRPQAERPNINMLLGSLASNELIISLISQHHGKKESAKEAQNKLNSTSSLTV